MFRATQLNVQTRTLKRLRLISKLYQLRSDNDSMKGMSPDELGDALINEAILRQYPAITELEAELRKVEEAFTERWGKFTERWGKSA